jgi:hypothetical protein
VGPVRTEFEGESLVVLQRVRDPALASTDPDDDRVRGRARVLFEPRFDLGGEVAWRLFVFRVAAVALLAVEQQAPLGADLKLAVSVLEEDAVRHAKRLIDARQYILRSRWQDVQPRAREQNAFLKAHSWEEYAAWHLGLTEGAAEETKARYAFVYGHFRRLHRMGLIACHYRAAEWRHKEIELAAHELLQYLDRKSASRRGGAERRGPA